MTEFFEQLADSLGLTSDDWESEVSDAEIEEEWDDGDDSFFE